MTRYADIATLRKHISPDVAIVDEHTPPALAAAELDAAIVALEANAGALGVDGGHGPTPDYYAAFLADAVGVPLEHGIVSQSIVLPLPPSANVYWRYTSTGVYVSEAAENYKAAVKLRALLQRMSPFAGEVAMYVHVYRQRKAGDLDNFAKVLGDSLNGVAYHDDSQVVELHMWRHDDKANPRVEVEIRRIA
jgi:crossover junction endodeoxyribonuclease RusA